MGSRFARTVVDLFVRRYYNVVETFGGKTKVVGGNFCQVLPVVRNVSALAVSINRRLTKNMRANDDPDSSDCLLKLGNANPEIQEEVSPNTIKIPR